MRPAIDMLMVQPWCGKVRYCGGRSNDAKREDGKAGRTSVIEEYDPEKNTWTVSKIELPLKISSHLLFSVK